jgi:hypothetical protein
MATDCSNVSGDKETGEGDDAAGSPEKGVNFSVSPMADQIYIAEINRGYPEEVSRHQRRSPNEVLLGETNKVLFGETPHEATTRKLVDSKQGDHEISSKATSPGLADVAPPANAFAAGTTRTIEGQVGSADDIPHDSSPLACVGRRNQAMSPEQDTMHKAIEGFSSPPVYDHGPPTADDLVNTDYTSTYSTEQQDLWIGTDGSDDNCEDAVHSLAGNYDDNSIDEYNQWIQRVTRLVRPDDLWKDVLAEMTSQGLTWRHESGLHIRAWTFPGRQEPRRGGQLHYDFVHDEFDLKTLAVDCFNWNGDDKYLLEKEERDGKSRRRNKRVQQTPPPSAPKRKKRKEVANPKVQQPQNIGFEIPHRSLSLMASDEKSTVAGMLQLCQGIPLNVHTDQKIIDVGHSPKFQAQVNPYSQSEFNKMFNEASEYLDLEEKEYAATFRSASQALERKDLRFKTQSRAVYGRTMIPVSKVGLASFVQFYGDAISLTF